MTLATHGTAKRCSRFSKSTAAAFGMISECQKCSEPKLGHEINRVFTICFPDKSARASFFADDRYREVRKNFFDESVEGSTLIAEYDIAGETL